MIKIYMAIKKLMVCLWFKWDWVISTEWLLYKNMKLMLSHCVVPMACILYIYKCTPVQKSVARTSVDLSLSVSSTTLTDCSSLQDKHAQKDGEVRHQPQWHNETLKKVKKLLETIRIWHLHKLDHHACLGCGHYVCTIQVYMRQNQILGMKSSQSLLTLMKKRLCGPVLG